MTKKRQKLEVWTLPEDLVLPLLAAVRLMERTINPAFDFIFRCNKCGEMDVKEVKSAKGDGTTIGIRCEADGCGQVIKFGRKLDLNASDFPARLKSSPDSALVPPGEEKSKVTASNKWIQEAFTLVLGDDDA